MTMKIMINKILNNKKKYRINKFNKLKIYKIIKQRKIKKKI